MDNKFKAISVKLPPQKGCEHIEVEIEDLDSKEKKIVVYHMSELIDDKVEENDDVLKYLKEFTKQKNIKDREQLKIKVEEKKLR